MNIRDFLKVRLVTCETVLYQQTAAAVGAGMWARSGVAWPNAWRPLPTQLSKNPEVKCELL